MAAEAVMGDALKVLIQKLIATAGEEISLMRGLKKEVASLKDSLEMVKTFLQDASRRQVEEESVKLWLLQLEDLAYEADNILDDINYEALRCKVEITNLMERCFYLCFNNPLVFCSKMAHRIKDLNLKLKSINDRAKELGLQQIFANFAIPGPEVRETSSFINDPIFLSRENEMSKIINMLVQPSEEVLSVIPITGMGGLGKTTLARKIFNEPKIVGRFKQRIWVCVSENFESKIIFNKMLGQSEDVRVLDAILQELQKKLKNGNYLLVLDDLWNDDPIQWDDFRRSLVGVNGGKGNFCLVTTRSEEVASVVNTTVPQPLDKISDDDCWLIIKKKAFPGEEVPKGLEEVGEKVASKCGGVPLAANIVGATLKGKEIEDWDSFLQTGFADSNNKEHAVLQVLKVSFDRLRSPVLKRCFSYCSIFCKDEELEKERLIQLWMAEGFLTGNDMESIGGKVYDMLLHNCFLQEAERDKYGNITHSKMHDLVHDLACSVSKAESFNDENCNIEKGNPHRLRYLAVGSRNEKIDKLMTDRATNLRTLVWRHGVLSNDVFKNVTNLHVLDIERSDAEGLKDSIGNLINLRLLDVPYSEIQASPDAICKLFNLQTLRIRCYKVERLPKGLQQLVSLRHLVFNGHKDLEMPLQIGKLTSLRTLEFFNVGHENGRRIEELGSLKNLKGELKIRHLERVNNKEEASRACLIKKSNIYVLKFVWSHSSESSLTGSGSNTCNNNDQEVLEGLQPHSNIKSLTIKGFKGDHFPQWILSSSVGATSSLDKLIEVRLMDCARCEEVPTLGHLPELKILELNSLKSVKSLGDSFYHLHGTTEGMSSERSRQQTTPFRALRSFKLRYMTSLEEWIEAPPTTSADKSRADRAFHRLEELEIYNCHDIEIVPIHDFPALQKLEIFGAGVTRLPCIGRHLEKLNISWCRYLESIEFSSEGGLTSSSSLKSIVVDDCEALTHVMLGDDLDYTSLETFKISDCRNVLVFNPVDFGRMPCLRILDVHGCPKLRRLPFKGVINCLRHLTELSLGPFSEDEEDTSSLSRFCDMLQGIHELQSLRRLELHGQPLWDSLPDQIQHLANLTELRLRSFGSVEALPEWLGNLSSLERLYIFNFKRLRKLPSKEAMQRLTKLEYLSIRGCPRLKKIKNPGSDAYRSEWPKISHIEDVFVYP